jgi:hypothetical protein
VSPGARLPGARHPGRQKKSPGGRRGVRGSVTTCYRFRGGVRLNVDATPRCGMSYIVANMLSAGLHKGKFSLANRGKFSLANRGGRSVHVATGLTRSRRTSDTCSVESVMLEQVKSVFGGTQTASTRQNHRQQTSSGLRMHAQYRRGNLSSSLRKGTHHG